MKTLILFFSLIIASSITAAQTKIEFISPFSAGGSTLSFVRNFSSELERNKFSVTYQFLGNCRLASQILSSEDKKFIYVWFSDLNNECPPPGGVTDNNLIGIINWSPLYFCGRSPTLDTYRTQVTRLGTNPGVMSTGLANNIKDQINQQTRVINYANTGAVKAALLTGEIDLVLHSSGKALEAEKLVTCYASTADVQINNMVTIQSLFKNISNSVTTNIGWFAAVNFDGSELAAIRAHFIQWTATAEFQSLVTQMHRELPTGTIDQQLIQINNSLK